MCHISIQERRCHDKTCTFHPQRVRGMVGSEMSMSSRRCTCRHLQQHVCCSAMLLPPDKSAVTTDTYAANSRLHGSRVLTTKKTAHVVLPATRTRPCGQTKDIATTLRAHTLHGVSSQCRSALCDANPGIHVDWHRGFRMRRHLPASFTRHPSSLLGTGEREDLQHCWALCCRSEPPHTTLSRTASAMERWPR